MRHSLIVTTSKPPPGGEIPDPEEQRVILAESEAALTQIDRKQTFHDWIRVGRSVSMLRNIAMNEAGTEDLRAYAYRTAFADVWGTTTANYPKLFRLTKTERTQAAWLWDNREPLEVWHRSLPAHIARRYNHPYTIWRKNPLQEDRKKSTATSAAVVEREKIRSVADELKAEKEEFKATMDHIIPRLERKGGVEPTAWYDLSDEMVLESVQNFEEIHGAAGLARFSMAALLFSKEAVIEIGKVIETMGSSSFAERIAKAIFAFFPEQAVEIGKALLRLGRARAF
jgi:hypothetical protein